MMRLYIKFANDILFRKEPKQDAPSPFFFREKETKNKPPSRPSEIFTLCGRIYQ